MIGQCADALRQDNEQGGQNKMQTVQHNNTIYMTGKNSKDFDEVLQLIKDCQKSIIKWSEDFKICKGWTITLSEESYKQYQNFCLYRDTVNEMIQQKEGFDYIRIYINDLMRGDDITFKQARYLHDILIDVSSGQGFGTFTELSD